MIRKSYPGGAWPYSAALISLSVPSTPTRSTFTSTPRPFGISSTVGFGMVVRCMEFGFPGKTATAFIVVSAAAAGAGGPCSGRTGASVAGIVLLTALRVELRGHRDRALEHRAGSRGPYRAGSLDPGR